MLETLNKEQREAFDAVVDGKSIFITGAGGTGKSYLLKALWDLVPPRTGKHIVITALTGCAALLLGRHAKTLHAWAGIGLGKESAITLAAGIKRSGKALRRWLGVDILVIDEVSMMTPELLEKLDAIAKLLRRDQSPMGGIQVVFVGDFFQLPPVNKEGGRDTQFAFESPLWNQIVSKTIQLKSILRQKDEGFQSILNDARVGQMHPESLKTLQARMNLRWQDLQIRPTLLFSRHLEVDNINRKNLKALKGEKKAYLAETVFKPVTTTQGLSTESPQVKIAVQKMDRDGSYMTELILGIGAQVMLISNVDFDMGLVNGSRGVVVGFDSTDMPIVQFMKGKPVTVKHTTWESEEIEGLSRKQIPLKLAYAITIHKSQGSTLDCALIDIGTSTFEYGQAYVALSRVKDLNSLFVWDVEPEAFRAHPRVLAFYEQLFNTN